MKAIWNKKIIAESNDTIVVENHHYFPFSSLKQQYFKPSEKTTHCTRKGEASYYSIEVDGLKNKDAAWYYASPKEAVKKIKGRVAFWRGIQVVE